MPTYGYRCTACGHEFEVFQKMSDPPVATCDECGAPVKKRLYPVGISFKGSGFYVNDYSKSAKSEGSESAPASASDAKPADPAAPAADGKSAESKPAATETKPVAPASATTATNS